MSKTCPQAMLSQSLIIKGVVLNMSKCSTKHNHRTPLQGTNYPCSQWPQVKLTVSWNFVCLRLCCIVILFYFEIPTCQVFLVAIPFPLFSRQCRYLSFHSNPSNTLFCVQDWAALSQLELVASFVCLPDVSREAIWIPPWPAALHHLRTTCRSPFAASLFVFWPHFQPCLPIETAIYT